MWGFHQIQKQADETSFSLIRHKWLLQKKLNSHVTVYGFVIQQAVTDFQNHTITPLCFVFLCILALWCLDSGYFFMLFFRF